MTIHELVASLEPEINAVRQQIHENPELGLKEYNTSALIEKELREKLMSETVQLRAQMDDYEDELNDMNDSVSYTNRLLNFILVLLILALLVVLGIVVYWILLQKGII